MRKNVVHGHLPGIGTDCADLYHYTLRRRIMACRRRQRRRRAAAGRGGRAHEVHGRWLRGAPRHFNERADVAPEAAFREELGEYDKLGGAQKGEA